MANSMCTKCSNVENIIVPDGVMYINSFTFAHMDNLKSITLPDSIIYIRWCFFSNSNIETLKVEDSVKYINVFIQI